MRDKQHGKTIKGRYQAPDVGTTCTIKQHGFELLWFHRNIEGHRGDFFGHPWFGCAPGFQGLDPYSAVRISVVPKLSSGFRVLVGVPSQGLDIPDLLVYSYFNHRCSSQSPTFRSKWIKTGDGTPIYRAIQWQNFMVFKKHLGFWGANDFWCKAILALALNHRCPMRFAAAWTWEVTCPRTPQLQSC